MKNEKSNVISNSNLLYTTDLGGFLINDFTNKVSKNISEINTDDIGLGTGNLVLAGMVSDYDREVAKRTINTLKDQIKDASFQKAMKEMAAEIWESSAEKLAAQGNKIVALGKLDNQVYKSLYKQIVENSKLITNSIDDITKIAKTGMFYGLKHLGPAAIAVDIGMAVISDDANAVVKAAITTAVGMAAGYVLAALPITVPIGAVIIAGAAVTAGLSWVWDKFEIGEKLGLVGESFSEMVSETVDIIEGKIDDLINIDWSYLDDFIIDSGKKFWNKLTGKEGIDEYTKFNRTGEFHVVNPDPITLDLDGDGIETVKIDGLNSILFDHDADGIRTATGWVKADDGLLVLDSNGDGKIDTGRELFGDNRLLKDGSLAPTGFAALAEHDDNGDGKIDAQDAVFEQLKVWRDLNQDGISQEGELFTLEQLGIQSLDLNHQAVNQRQGNGNSVARLGSYTDSEGKEHLMGDLLFDSNPMISRFTDKIALSAEQRQAPKLLAA